MLFCALCEVMLCFQRSWGTLIRHFKMTQASLKLLPLFKHCLKLFSLVMVSLSLLDFLLMLTNLFLRHLNVFWQGILWKKGNACDKHCMPSSFLMYSQWMVGSWVSYSKRMLRILQQKCKMCFSHKLICVHFRSMI